MADISWSIRRWDDTVYAEKPNVNRSKHGTPNDSRGLRRRFTPGSPACGTGNRRSTPGNGHQPTQADRCGNVGALLEQRADAGRLEDAAPRVAASVARNAR